MILLVAWRGLETGDISNAMAGGMHVKQIQCHNGQEVVGIISVFWTPKIKMKPLALKSTKIGCLSTCMWVDPSMLCYTYCMLAFGIKSFLIWVTQSIQNPSKSLSIKV